jgi:hypothetical protein
MTTVTDEQKSQLVKWNWFFARTANTPLAPTYHFVILIFLSITLFLCQNSLAGTNPAPVFELKDIGIKQEPNYFITIYPDGKIHYQGFNSFVNDDRYAQITHEQLDAFTIYFFSLPFAASKKYEIKRGFERWHQTIDYKGAYSRIYIDDPIFFYALIKKLDALIHLQQWICFPINHPYYNDHCMGGDIPTNLDDLKNYYNP